MSVYKFDCPIAWRDVRASDIENAEVTWALDEFLPLSLALILGRKRVGKTTLLARIAEMLMNGSHPGSFHGKGCDLAYATRENDFTTFVRPRMEAAGVPLHRLWLCEERWVLPRDLDRVAAYIEARKLGALFLDPLGAFVPRLTDPGQAREAMEGLVNISHALRCLILGAHHFIKAGRDIDSAAAGAAAVLHVPRAVYLLGGQPSDPWSLLALNTIKRLKEEAGVEDDAPDDMQADEDVRILAPHHLNVGALPQSLRFSQQLVVVGALERAVPVFNLTGPSDWVAEAVYSAKDFPAIPEAIEEAATLILTALVDGAVRAEDLLARANAEGIRDRTLERARAALKKKGVIRYFKGEDGKGWWALVVPDAPDF